MTFIRRANAWVLRIRYIALEIPRRALRLFLCSVFGLDRWHVAAGVNKPYVADVIRFLEAQRVGVIVEVGSGFCDLICGVRANRRIAYDADPGVVRAAKLYTAAKMSRVEVRQHDFVAAGVPKVQGDVWLFVNWIHAYSEEKIRPLLRSVFESLEDGGMIILDMVSSPSYPHQHDPRRIFKGLHFDLKLVGGQYPDGRSVFAVIKRSC